ncbi:MAG TPA: type VI secretion system tip protein VgrG [Phnomibacter sp.]|nr:type VI secretion system tip protein VgrG [Phnomibacter sp.]
MPVEVNIQDGPTTVSYTIKADGTALSPGQHVVSVVVYHGVDRLSFARIIMLDGEAASRNFPLSDQANFLPGKAIEVSAGYGQDEAPIFKGIVVKHSLQLKANNTSLLVVDARHEAVKMTKVRKSRILRDKTDSELFETLVEPYGLTPEADSTSPTHEGMVQHQCTDWDMVIARAQANALLVLCEPGKLLMKKPDLTGNALVELAYGMNLYEMDLQMDARSQLENISIRGWDPADQQMLETDGNAPAGWQEPGNFSQADLAAASGESKWEWPKGTSLNEAEMRVLASGRLMQHQLSKIRGHARCKGHAMLKPGVMVALTGAGERFNGKHFVSAVRHEISQGSWYTNVELGLLQEPFIEKFDVNEKPASAVLPAVNGLQVGIVTQLASDPQDEDRVLVKLPAIDGAAEGVWARQALLDAGKERGSFFRPEVGDEVVVGFLNDDPRHPVILGMFNSSAKPAILKADDDNHQKGFVTREKLKLWFDDEKKIIEVSTPGGRKVVLDDDKGEINMEDADGNQCKMDADGITLNSAKDIILKATGNIKMEGVEVKAEGSGSATIKGGSSAEFSSGGTTNLKGSLVNIN